MKNCLVTKLKENVSDNSLLRLGEMKIDFDVVASPNKVTQGIALKFIKDTTLRVVNGYFTNSTLSSNLGTTLSVAAQTVVDVFVSNSGASVICNKYDLSYFSLYPIGEGAAAGTPSNMLHKKVNLEDLAYAPYLRNIALINSSSYGDISTLQNLQMSNLIIANTQIYGDLSSLDNTLLAALNCANAQISANLSVFSNVTAPTLNLNNIGGTITGDLATLGNAAQVLLINTDTNLTWSSRDSSKYKMSIQGSPKIDNIDKMLIDQAACVTPTTSVIPKSSWLITATGTRTTRSDAAVNTLKNAGYTIIINNVVL